MSKNNNETPVVNIRFKNLHIHMDEHMDSTNFYNAADACCDECCTCDDEVVIDSEKLIEQIHKETHISHVIIDRILSAEQKILEELGVAEVLEDDCEEEYGEDDASEEGESNDFDEDTCEDAHSPNPCTDCGETHCYILSGSSEGNVIPKLVALVLNDILGGPAADEKKKEGEKNAD